MTLQCDRGFARMFAGLLLAGLLAACAGGTGQAPEPHLPATPPPPAVAETDQAPSIVETAERLECAVYARSISGIALFGTAWTWWDQAAGVYERGYTPQPGAVLVLREHGQSQGHIAVVVRVVDSRTIVAEHANWLNRGEIQKNSPILDVSPANDWSQVRVWYTPGNSWGISTYPAYGFIYPRLLAMLEQEREEATAGS